MQTGSDPQLLMPKGKSEPIGAAIPLIIAPIKSMTAILLVVG
jgi:hypothetical protein